jgi:hypothetical protein
MSYGFSAKNSSGQVLISSDLQNYHFHSKLSSIQSTLGYHDTYGGMYNYRFEVIIGTDNPPLVFIEPRCDNIQAMLGMDIVSDLGGGNKLWYIDVAVAGINVAAAVHPYLYIFTKAGAITDPTGQNWGLTVYNDNNDVAFDSRKAPLVILGGNNVTPPSTIITASQDLNPNSAHWVEKSLEGLSSSDIMFCAPSLAQAEREYTTTQHSESCTGLDICGACIGWASVWDRSDTWWAFYRNGFQLKDNKFKSGWLTFNVGHHYYETDEDSFLGIRYDGGSSTGGQQAINNGQINMNTNAYLFSKPSLYS